MLKVSATLGFFAICVALPAHASAPAAWAALDRQSATACAKASGLAGAKAGPPLHYSDATMIDARIVSGVYPQAHMKRAKGTMLCIFNRRTARAEVQDAASILPPAASAPSGFKDVMWRGERIEGAPVLATANVRLMFDSGGHVSGRSGCNNFSARYALDEKALRVFPPMIGTRMACPAPVMALEARFLDILGKGVSVSESIVGRLIVKSSDGRTLAFVRE